ncbi:tetratricopeptide repeat protein [Thermodesulfobacteriota bacterium]
MVCLLLIVAALAVFWQVQHFDFVNFDDNDYIYENRHVQKGVALESIAWAFTTTHVANWHPLTWLSHMLDCQLFGLNPGRHHLTNLLFHIANTLLLFAVFRKMTGGFWQSAFVSVLFALHPLHVESVAWVSERKDVLSTFFWMLTMWSYICYVEHPSMNRYLWIVLFFILGLMSKPMLVTLPFLLLLLDYWPLNRLQTNLSGTTGSSQQKSIALRLVWEKAPLFVLVAISSAVTFYAQKHGGAVASLDVIPLKARFANALVAYVKYIGKMIYPVKLAVLYPYPTIPPWWKITTACLFLTAISSMAIRTVRQRPYFIVGWLWYIGTLVPVIGLVQVGRQAMADRYTYVPLIGLFIIIAWGVPAVVARYEHSKKWLVALATVLVSILTATTWIQIGYWKNSVTLFEHALEHTNNNSVMQCSLGVALADQGRRTEAIRHYSESLRINPNYAKAHNNMGIALQEEGKMDEAFHHYAEALRVNPNSAKAHNNLGSALAHLGRMDEAIAHFSKALKINPDDSKTHNNLGIALLKTGRVAESISHYTAALRLNPDYAEAHMNLGIELNNQGRTNEAIEHFQKALSLEPEFTEAMYHLAKLNISRGKYQDALFLYQKIIDLLPDNPAVYYNIACIYARQNKPEESILWLTKAIEKGFGDWEHIKTDKDLGNIRNSLQYQEIVKGH